MTDYSALKRLAEAATPGRRSVDNDVHGELHVIVDGLDLATVGVTSDTNPSADADFIAAANPATVLALIGELDRLRGYGEEFASLAERRRENCEQLKAEVEALRKDAERYRWLRDSSEAFHSFYLSTPIWLAGAKFSKENVDGSIDSAISKEAGQ
jgi:hypothetical protein